MNRIGRVCFTRRWTKLGIFLILLVTLLPFITRRLARLRTRFIHHDLIDVPEACPRFRHHSRFRETANHQEERQIELALLQLQRESDHSTETEYPVQKIWQIWKDANMPDGFKPPQTWTSMHPGWDHTLVSDADATRFVTDHFSTIPGLVSIWSSYPRPVLRADLLRYLLLWYHGGLYVDIDTRPVRPVPLCGPLAPIFSPTTTDHNVSLVVGVEIGEPYASIHKRKRWHWSRTFGFIQYSLYAPRRFSPVLRRVVVRALAHSLQHQRRSTRWYRNRYSDEDVLEITGPGMFTDAVLDILSDTLPPGHHFRNISSETISPSCPTPNPGMVSFFSGVFSRITWLPFHQLQQPVWIDADQEIGALDLQRHGGVLVLPINVWGNGQRHSGAQMFDSPQACLNHLFRRVWKKRKWYHI